MYKELLEEVLQYFETANIFFDEADNVEALCIKIERALAVYDKKLANVLNELIFCAEKLDDAPMSSKAHLDSAIIRLRSVTPGWDPLNSEHAEIIADIEKHTRIVTETRETLLNMPEHSGNVQGE